MPFAAPATDQGTHPVALRPSPVRNTRKHNNNRVIARSRSTLENNSESYPALPLGAKQNPQIAIDLLAHLSGSHYRVDTTSSPDLISSPIVYSQRQTPASHS